MYIIIHEDTHAQDVRVGESPNILIAGEVSDSVEVNYVRIIFIKI